MDNWIKFRELLDKQYEWPAEYKFKFIVPFDRQLEVENLFSDFDLSLRASKTGKFVSVTFSKLCLNSNEVIQIYEKAKTIKDLMVL